MKKIALIISMMALLAFNLNAQEKQGRTTSFGLKLGPNLDWAFAGSTETSSNGAGLGFSFGGIVDHYFTKHVAVSSGFNFNFMNMGYQFTDFRTTPEFLEEAKVSVNRRFRGSYFEIPVKVKAKFDVVDSWKAYFEAGFGLSYNFADRGKDTFDDPFGQPYADNVYKSYFYQYSWFQAAINFGVGTIFEINKKFSLFAQLTFNNALSNSFSHEIETQTGSIIRTNFVGLEVGIIR